MNPVFDSIDLSQVATLTDILCWRAQHEPLRGAYTFLLDGEAKKVQMTYADLDREARRIAALLKASTALGDRVLLLYPPSLEYVTAIFGCWLAGVVAVPAYPPRLNQSLMRIQTILQDARVSVALTISTVLSSLRRTFARDSLMQDLQWIETDTMALEVGLPPALREFRTDPAMLALLQYTSGSTGDPKGVMLTHANLMQNAALVQESMSLTSEDRGMFWLPPYHDMGLMGGILQALYTGYPTVLMAPTAFVQQPLRWLQAISSFQVTVSGAPNFAYDLCVKKATEDTIKTLDLSSWTLAFTGAEPVRAETLQHFAEVFAPYGFRLEAFYPCYGLAETTLFVSGVRRLHKPKIRAFDGGALETGYAVEATGDRETGRHLVSCGFARQGQEVAIVDPEKCTCCAAGRIGEIWVRGPNVALGYWGKAEETVHAFQAFLCRDVEGVEADRSRRDDPLRSSVSLRPYEGPFLRTGDLGFFVENELYVTGRLKDLIVIRGRNLYPQDIEQIVEKSHPLLRRGCCAAFAVDGRQVQDAGVAQGTTPTSEQLVVVQEVVRHADDVGAQEAIQAICQAVLSEFDVEVVAIELLRAGTIPKTSSGKIQRHACRQSFLKGDFNVVYRWSRTQEHQHFLALQNKRDGDQTDRGLAQPLQMQDIVDRLVIYIAERAHMDVHAVDVHAPFIAFGLNSLEAIGLSNELEQWLGRSLSPTLVYEYPSIEALARALDEAELGTLSVGTGLAPVRKRVGGEPLGQGPALSLRDSGTSSSKYLPLSHTQEALWFHSSLAPESTAYNLLYAVRIRSCLDVVALQRALEVLANRYPILTSTYTLQNGEPVQQTQKNQPLLQEIDASSASLDDLKVLLQEESNRPIDLTKGPVFRLQLYRRADDDYILGFILHHIVADFWALDILVEELQYLYLSEKTDLDSPSGNIDEVCNTGEASSPVDIDLHLQEPGFQHADYVHWQQSMLQSQEGAYHWQYWQNTLAGDLPILHLPTDRPRPPIQTYQGASHNFSLSTDLEKQLRTLANETQVTLFTLMLTAYQVLLHRYSNQDDILIGVPALGRTHSELEHVIGFLANPVVVRARFEHQPTFKELLHQTERGVLSALAHQDFPFSLLVERLQPIRDPSTSPIYQTLFIWNRPRVRNREDLARLGQGEQRTVGAGQEPYTAPALSLEPFAYGQQGAPVDLTLMIFETEDVGAQDPHLRADFCYNVDLFDASTISRMAEHFLTLLTSIVNDPDQHVREIPLLSESECQRLLIEWSATRTGGASPPLQDLCVHQLFELQVELTPDAIALTFGKDKELTYAELNRRANQVAYYLQSLGVGPEVLVGITLERSIEMIVVLLGVLKAGGAYVPLDPTYPGERIAFMMQDTHVHILVTQQQLSGQIPASTAHLLVLEQVWETIISQADQNPRSQVEASNLAYIIYTSGSTGVPKGVQITHRGLSNLGLTQANTFAIRPGSRVLQFASLNFDASIWEILMALLVGGCLHLKQMERMLPGPDLWRVLQEQAITCVTLPPSALAVLPTSGRLSALQTLVVAGEACPVGLMTRWARDRHFFNAYGPTETTVCASMAPCSVDQADQNALLQYPMTDRTNKENPTWPPTSPNVDNTNRTTPNMSRGLSLGQPLANTQFYILDQHLQPVPLGVPGEIYLGGVSLARGYLHQPEATAWRFVPNPFVGTVQTCGTRHTGYGADPGARLYRTGDLARYRPDGSVEYLGRVDSQVKLRGFRIELGEIEAVLRACPVVQEAVVVLQEEGQDRQYLVAYVVARDGASPIVVGDGQAQVGRDEPEGRDKPLPLRVALQEHLRKHLPYYMVPTFVIFRETLPLTSNGKVDRKALPMLDIVGAGLVPALHESAEMVAPQTPLQERLAVIWAELLNLPQVGIHDNFFELGGHSLLATRLIARVRTLFQVEIPLRRLFETPTIADMALIIEQIQREQIAQAENKEDISQAQILPQERHGNIFPLSFAQRRLWFLQQLEPQSPFYNVPAAFRLTGWLHVDVLERSLAVVVQRHEVLRTTFPLQQKQPVQAVAPSLPIPVVVIDLHGLPAAQGTQATKLDRQVVELARAEAQRPFDLTCGPLLRIYLLRLGKPTPTATQEHILLFTLHHIVADGWSSEIFMREIALLYQAQISSVGSGLAPDLSLLPEIPIQYADYTLWQHQWLQGEVLESQLSYWRRQLAEAPGRGPGRGPAPSLQLPTDRPRPAVQRYVGAQQVLLVSPQLLEQLKSLSQREGVTLFMTLLATFQVLLMRYSGQHDIVVGTPIANRTREELENLIGFFVNTLVLRTDLSGNPSFLQLLARVREVALQAYAHQDVPFEKLVEELQPERDLSRQPLFQVLFSLQNTPPPRLELPGIYFSPMQVENQVAKFDLSLTLTEEQTGLQTVVEYNTDLFDATTITRLSRHWQVLLEAIVRDPGQDIETLPLLMEAEREQILAQGTVPTERIEVDLCVHQLFEQQVELMPDAIALVFEDEVLTYAELNGQANRLAYRLLEAEVGPDVLVGVCMERSLEMVIALLAILKAGGAYVPLDPDYPQERLTFLLEDAQVAVVLTQAHLRDLMEQAHKLLPKVELICLGLDTSTGASPVATSQLAYTDSQNRDNPPCWVQPDNLAYLIYTSGSTGRPKGVQITHANVSRLFRASANYFCFQPSDVWTLFHSYAFDFSVWEIWGALHSGGRLVIVPYWLSRSPDLFWRELAREQVTILNQTPSAFRQLMRVQDGRRTSLHTVIFGGEALDLASLESWVECYGDEAPQLINMYGITETTVHVTYRRLHEDEIRTGAVGTVQGSSPIGQPLSDLDLYVLDRWQQPVPIGVAGEVYVGGAGLARGYLKRPDLTAERFVPHPFNRVGIGPAPVRGERLYRTGDLARYRETGELEYLGRIDSQVKIRGFRIELSEIEVVLLKHPSVKEAVVVVWEETPGNKQIVAYVVDDGSKEIKSGDLRCYLQDKLPDYMVPAIFTLLEELPQTSHGKLDRKALPTPDRMRPDRDSAGVAARTPTEEVLAVIWASVLGREQVGIHENFFALGGDSIRSIQVLSQARERGIHFSLQHLFREQTISELVQVLGAESLEGYLTEPVQAFSLLAPEDLSGYRFPADVEDAYPLTMLQAGMVFHSESDPASAVYHDILSCHLEVQFNREYLQTTLEQLAACHSILRTSFDISAFSEPLQLVYRSVEIPLQVQDLRTLSQREQEEVLNVWFEEEKSRPFVWTQPPLVRFQIHLRSETSFQLTMSFHHAILDGWSVASLLTELMKVYLSLLSGEDASFASPPRLLFRDFVALERKLIASQEAREYWQKILHDSMSARLARWTSVQPPDNASVYELPVPISQEVSAHLKKIAQDISVPIKSVLLAAHLRVLSFLHGQADILTGLVSNGRPEVADGERTLGLFLNTLPFRLKLSGGTWVELIRETFAAECEGLVYRWYPLTEIQKQIGAQALFETIFNFVHFHVYQGVLKVGKDTSPSPVRLLGSNTFEKTNFTLVANFSLDPISSQVHLSLRCDTKELCIEQVKTIGGYYTRALVELSHEPDGRYEWQTLLSEREREQVLTKWNATGSNYPQDLCIHQLFEQQVRRTPDAVALVFEEQILTYAELNRRANQLADHLQTLGVGPEVVVGICLPRSLQMVVALLGILKAGGTYLPLDPIYPPDRLAFMLGHSQVRVLITTPHLRTCLPSESASLVFVDAGASLLAQLCDTDSQTCVAPNNLAYIIYTSGSTGRPKGVPITHANLLNLVFWHQQAFNVACSDRATQLASPAFDAMGWEVWPYLAIGAPVFILANEEIRTTPSLLCNWLMRHAITITFLPTALAESVLDEQWPSATALRLLLTGAEALHRYPSPGLPFALINNYGPTEATVVATSGLVPPGEREMVPPSIGGPVANTQIYILDQHLQPTPIGTLGELYIGGAGLARGYFADAELTAEKFLPHPFAGTVQTCGARHTGYSADPGARLYRTGDLARYRPDGTIEYLGRSDNQVKLRGFRIELGEIEAVLRSCPVVQEAVVVLQEENVGTVPCAFPVTSHSPYESLQSLSARKYLVAYVVARAGVDSREVTVRGHLRKHLPDYMVPTLVVFLQTLPLNPNGKVDRKALSVLDFVGEGLVPALHENTEIVAPQTPLQEQLAVIWAELLFGDEPRTSKPQVGIQHNFFELGGHSLLAIQLIARVRALFQVELPLRRLFETPTIAGMALAIEQTQSEQIEQAESEKLVQMFPTLGELSEDEIQAIFAD